MNFKYNAKLLITIRKIEMTKNRERFSNTFENDPNIHFI